MFPGSLSHSVQIQPLRGLAGTLPLWKERGSLPNSPGLAELSHCDSAAGAYETPQFSKSFKPWCGFLGFSLLVGFFWLGLFSVNPL